MYACILYREKVVKGESFSGRKIVAGRYRVWIVRYESRPPDTWHGVPLGAIAVEPAERGTMSGRRARGYVEAFNRSAQRGGRKIWAVAVPVAVRYLGEPRSGEKLAAGP